MSARTAIIALLMLGLSQSISAQETIPDQKNYRDQWQSGKVPFGSSVGPIQYNPSMTIRVGKTYVVIKPDGKIEYGEDYTPDAAAKAFWDAVGVERKARNCP